MSLLILESSEYTVRIVKKVSIGCGLDHGVIRYFARGVQIQGGVHIVVHFLRALITGFEPRVL